MTTTTMQMGSAAATGGRTNPARGLLAMGLALLGLATGAVVQAQTLPDLISYTFTVAETKTLPGTSAAPGAQCNGTIAAADQIGALALVATFYQNGCYTDGRYNHNNYRVDRGTVSASGGAANLAAFKIYEPANKATQFLASQHAIYYRFPTKENYTVYTYSGGALSKVGEVLAAAIPNTTDLIPVPSAASPITVSAVVGSITYVFVPSATRVSSFALLAPGVEGARVASTAFGDVLKYRYTVAGTPFDPALDYSAGPDAHANAYSDARRFFLVRNADNLGAAWQAQGGSVLNLTWFGADRKSPTTVALPNPQAQRLACATGDDTGNVYYLTVQPGSGAPNTTRAATLTKVGPTGTVIVSTPVDMSANALNMVAFDGVLPNVATLKFLNGKLALMTGRTMHQSGDGLNHQGGVAAVFNATTLVIERDWGQTSGHSFENVLTTNSNGEFVGIDLGDNFPRGIHLHKFTGSTINSRVVSTFKTQHATTPASPSGATYPVYTAISGGGTTYYQWSNDNRTYTELGGVAQTALGYAVAFVGERSAGGRLLDNSRVGSYVNDPRNIGWVTVREDFQNASGSGAEVSDDLVVSTGLVETAGFFGFTGGWTPQRNAGVVWLTQYASPTQNASRLKMTSRADGSQLLLWEVWTASSYVATKAMTVAANGTIVNGETDLTSHVRLTRRDDPLRVNNSVYLVAGNKNDTALELIVVESQTLTVTKSGTGVGTVTSSPVGIDCGATCSASFAAGSTLTLTATANAGSVFAGWTGGGCTGTGSCTFTFSAATTVTATFNTAPAGTFALTVVKSGTGSGTVTSAPAGISCGTSCVFSFNANASVTLTAVPAAGSTFSGWNGGGCTGTSSCQVTMDAAKSVTATFNASTPTTVALTVSKAGTGSGTVTSSPAGISCGSTCSATFSTGTSVGLSAVASSGATFAGWSGACTGTAGCTVTMDAAKSVTATFTTAFDANVRTVVSGYYQTILGRAADQAGLDFWAAEATRVTGLGADVREVFFAMSMAFFSSSEYVGRNTTDALYLTDLYRTFFNRTPDASGFAYWQGELTASGSRSALLNSFLFSAEFSNQMTALFGTTSVRPEITLAMDLFRGVFGRLPDSAGFTYWLGRLRTAQCQGAAAVAAETNSIAGLFFNSTEYVARSRSNRDFTGDVYNAYLRRGPGGDSAGFNYWVGQIPVLGRDGVRAQFVPGAEFQNRVTAVVNSGCLP